LGRRCRPQEGKQEEISMRVRSISITASFVFGLVTSAFGQNPQTPAAPRGPMTSPPFTSHGPLNCPPGVDEQKAPAVGGETTGSGGNLSRNLSESEGVVCPPAGVDAGIVEHPFPGGSLRVIPPPGSPGGDQSIRPK
jgi:hypothetical protein